MINWALPIRHFYYFKRKLYVCILRIHNRRLIFICLTVWIASIRFAHSITLSKENASHGKRFFYNHRPNTHCSKMSCLFQIRSVHSSNIWNNQNVGLKINRLFLSNLFCLCLRCLYLRCFRENKWNKEAGVFFSKKEKIKLSFCEIMCGRLVNNPRNKG